MMSGKPEKSPPKYRSVPGLKHSSSDSDSDNEENTPLWRKKQEKYFRNQKEGSNPARSSPTLPEYRQNRPICTDNSDSSRPSVKKKVNNIWGSVIQEQDLTQTLKKSGSVQHVKDYNERTVESYDFTNRFKDSRPHEEAEENEEKDSEIHDPFEKVISSAKEKSLPGRSVIGYEDAMDVDGRSKKQRNHTRKRKIDQSDDKPSGVHGRLGPKKQTTMQLGSLDISVDMEDYVVAKKIADHLNEPKVELIERVIQSLGKEFAIRVLNMTRDVEDAGGMLTFDGSRRRTAGGVYLQLLKQQPECTAESKKVIFVESFMERQEMHQRKKKHRKLLKMRRDRFKDHSMETENPQTSKQRSKSPSSELFKGDGSEDDSDGSGNDQRLKGHSLSSSEPVSFQDELAAAKELILTKSRSREEAMEAEVDDGKIEDKENLDDSNDLEEAGANVVEIEFGDS